MQLGRCGLEVTWERYYLPALPARRNARILDFGTGAGRLLDFLAARGYSGARGFDRVAAHDLTHRVRSLVAIGPEPAVFLEAEDTWDCIVLREVLYYFEAGAARDLLVMLRRHLAPGGILVVEAINGACLTAPYVKFKDHEIRELFTEHSLRRLLEDAGFEVKSVVGMRPSVTGLRSTLFWCASWFWQPFQHLIFWLDRGADPESPSTFAKTLFVLARA